MKQTILYPDLRTGAWSSGPCLGKLALSWSIYGYAMALLWQTLPRGPVTDAAAWLVALLGGLALAGWTKGV